jgi:hypothetical protein
MKSDYITIDLKMRRPILKPMGLIAILLAVMAMFIIPAVPAAAASPVEVEEDKPGLTSWAIANIAPGDSGTETVTIKNTGSRAATLEIWVSKLTSTEGTPADFQSGGSGDLDENLELKVTAPGLTSNIAMPAIFNLLPKSAKDTRYIEIPKINAGASVDLTWEWNLPSSVGNEVQGDSLTFDITYDLTEIAPRKGGGGGPVVTPIPTPTPTPSATASPPEESLRYIQLELPDSTDQSVVTSDGVITEGLAATTGDSMFSLSIEQWTRVGITNQNCQDQVDLSLVGESIPGIIKVTIPEMKTLPPFPEGWVAVSQPYDINGITNGFVTGVELDRSAKLVLKYDEDWLPEYVDGLAAFYYNYESGWTQVEPPAGFIAEGPEVAAATDHFSLFIVLARNGTGPNPPANIQIQKLSVDPSRIFVGQSSDIRVRIINKGGMTGEYTVVVKVDSKVQKTQSVKLKPGESTEMALILTPGRNGRYTITAGPKQDYLIVDPLLAPDVTETGFWWPLGLAFLIAIMIFLILRRLRRKKEEEAETEGKKEEMPTIQQS